MRRKSAIVGEKFFEAGAGDVGELEFGLLGGAGRFRAFEDVLFAGAGSLAHLVDSAVALFEKALRETEREIENNLGLLIGKQLAIIAMRREEFGGRGHIGPIRPMCPIGPIRRAKSRPNVRVARRCAWVTSESLHRLLTLFFGCAFLVSCGQRSDPLHSQTEQFFALPLDGAITLENGGGSIHVYGWYEPRVRLVASRQAYTEQRLREIRVETKAAPVALAIRTFIPRARGFLADRSGTVDYSLNVPEPSHLHFKLRDGEITLSGLRGGSADISLTNGRVTALDCFAQVRAHSVNGVLEVFFQWWENLPASFDYTLGHGRIGVLLPATTHLQVDARTTNGRIHNGFRLTPIDFGAGQKLTGATVPNPPLSLGLRTGDGNINIDLIR